MLNPRPAERRRHGDLRQGGQIRHLPPRVRRRLRPGQPCPAGPHQRGNALRVRHVGELDREPHSVARPRSHFRNPQYMTLSAMTWSPGFSARKGAVAAAMPAEKKSVSAPPSSRVSRLSTWSQLGLSSRIRSVRCGIRCRDPVHVVDMWIGGTSALVVGSIQPRAWAQRVSRESLLSVLLMLAANYSSGRPARRSMKQNRLYTQHAFLLNAARRVPRVRRRIARPGSRRRPGAWARDGGGWDRRRRAHDRARDSPAMTGSSRPSASARPMENTGKRMMPSPARAASQSTWPLLARSRPCTTTVTGPSGPSKSQSSGESVRL